MKVGDFIVERLHAWGVRRIYGYPGDGINGVIGALQRAGSIEFIQSTSGSHAKNHSSLYQCPTDKLATANSRERCSHRLHQDLCDRLSHSIWRDGVALVLGCKNTPI